MIISDNDVQAYVDGELAPDDAARMDAAIAADVLVAARVERAKRLRAQVRGAFDPVLGEPLPSRLSGLLQAGAASNVVSMREREPAAARSSRWRVPAVALAASLAAFALVHWMRLPSADMVMQGGALVAHGELVRRLDTGLASTPDAASTIDIGLTFRGDDGRVCRSFVAHATHMAGLACREGDEWALPMVSRVDAAAGDLRQTANAMPADVQAAIDARIQGDAFDATQEQQARDAGWR